MASGLLPKSPVSSSLCDEVPHIFIPKSHLEPREFLISSAKRLLQQYRHIASFRCAAKFGRFRAIADIGGFSPSMVCPLMTDIVVKVSNRRATIFPPDDKTGRDRRLIWPQAYYRSRR